MVSLTIQDIESVILKEEYTKIGVKTVVCALTLRNGFEVIGTSACVDPANFDLRIGSQYAREKAIDKIWELEGYRLQNDTYTSY